MLDYFLQRSIKSKLRNYKREHSFRNFGQIKDVLILFNIDQWDQIQPIIKDLQKNKKSVIAWTIRPKDKSQVSLPDYVRVVQPDEINWVQLFKNNITSEFKKLSYDTLFDFCTLQDNHLLLLLLNNSSHFCVGFQNKGYKLHNFILHKDENQRFIDAYNDLKNYLEHIQQS